jgi:transcriptional regulator with XRE-family HTH domain
MWGPGFTLGMIRLARAYRGLSQRELGQRAGIHPARLWKIERGVSAPRPDELERLLRTLQIGELHQFLEGRQELAPKPDRGR